MRERKTSLPFGRKLTNNKMMGIEQLTCGLKVFV